MTDAHIPSAEVGPRIHILDTQFMGMEQVTAVFLVIGPDGPMLIETGPGSTLPTILDALAELSLKPADINHILLTHIHLDHAGAAGWWAQQGAQIYVHEVGAPHLIDPSRLLESAGRIYGDRMDDLWGEVLPAPAGKVTALRDGDVVRVNGLEITAVDTPGHAWHHHTYQLGDLGFTGDAAGIRMPHVALPDIPAPPPEFKLEVWLATLDKLAAQNFRAIFPTHFGHVQDAAAQLTAIRALLVDSVAFIAQRLAAGDNRDAILEAYVAWNEERAALSGIEETAVSHLHTANPPYMSVDGILRYLNRRNSS